ncbi:SMP-30/gluconolactonase/LRE family protein [Photobacterium sp. ZSDE20]|uniref:SMP-30/gluconolactonase/LRE family protein n=1 Tax=Photobacterium pectinilyticum TaxID=2906793 RepID=A0ABT1N6N4_9GAMM|nr:SMP-30/gluconolactonase/LRE family protein [Photobacterium sp. ZSDE20]MCQ1060197.1 SMP-30/gluconolactonase/LRE family protein [Photobacterium sp. ZSDE20]MDD1827642.1 SMP-30/gluconolactonase/LRE family protein [Photobacterium sp. ZSDE20]
MNIPTFDINTLLPLGIHMNVGESPIWNARRQKWVWLDQAGRIYEFDSNMQLLSQRNLPEKLGSLILTESDCIVVSGERSLYRFDITKPDIEQIATMDHPHQPMKFADGRCDRQGRYMVSTMNPVISDKLAWGQWWNFSHQQGFKRADTFNYIIPNGSAFSPDGKSFYCTETESSHRKVYRCGYDIDDGVITSRELIFDFTGLQLGRPDGAAVDTDGCYWICGLDDGTITRLTPDGKIDQVLSVPMKKPTMCAFGGKQGNTMLVTSLSRGIEDLVEDPYGGRIMMIEMPYQGIEEPRLKGY